MSKESIELVTDRASTWQICLPEKAGRITRFAARELRNTIERMTNASLPIGERDGEGPCVCFVEDESLDAEGYVIDVTPGRVEIRGHGNGVLYAVYAVLEEWGCRFVVPGDDCVPKVTSLRLSAGVRAGAPDVSGRMVRVLYPLKDDDPVRDLIDQIDWCGKNRINSITAGAGWRGTPVYMGRALWCSGRVLAEEVAEEALDRGLEVFVGGHSFFHWCPPSEYYEEHPEYFSEIEGERKPKQLCLTNPEVVDVVSRRICDLLTREPAVKGVSLTPMDGNDWCDCPDCRKADEPITMSGGAFKDTQSRSRGLCAFLDQVAQRVEKEHPDAWVTCYAYFHYTEPPENFTFTANNIGIWLLWYWACATHAMSDPACENNRFFHEASEKWRRCLGGRGRLYAGDYHYGMSAWCLAPWPALRLAAANWDDAIARGINGYSFQYYRADTLHYRLTNHLWARFLWDARKTKHWQDGLREACKAYLGPAAGDLAVRYYLLLEKLAEEYDGHLEPSITAYLNALIDQDALAQLENLADALRITPTGPVQARRISRFLWQHRIMVEMWQAWDALRHGEEEETGARSEAARDLFEQSLEHALRAMRCWPDEPSMIKCARDAAEQAAAKLGRKVDLDAVSADDRVAEEMIENL